MEFASPAWFELFQKISIAAAGLGVIDGVACEVYRNVPRHLAADGAIAWTRRAAGGTCTLDFAECADDEATLKIRADYAALLPLARVIVGTDDNTLGAMMSDVIAAGHMEIFRDGSDAPRNYFVHNLMAALTL